LLDEADLQFLQDIRNVVFLEGYLVGLGMVIFIGPVFFTLLKSTLQYGFAAGMLVATGIVISDVVCVGLCLFGAKAFFQNPENQVWIAGFGSIILFGIGFKYLLKPTVYSNEKLKLKVHHYSGFFMKGFLINFINPFVFLVWIGLISLSYGKYGFSSDLGIWLTGALLGIFSTDSLKVIFANNVKAVVQPKVLILVYKVIGLLLIGFGIRMLVFAFFGNAS